MGTDKAARRDAVNAAFGRALRDLRDHRALSQEALGHESETGRTYISQLERAERGPSLATVFDLAVALRVTPTELVEATEAELKWTSRSRKR